jgi:hypothetical protein
LESQVKNSLTHQYSGFGRLRTVLVLAGVVSLFFTSVSIAALLQPKALEYSKTHQLQQSQSLDGKGTIITSVCRSKTYIKDDPQNDYLWNLDHNCFAAGEISLSNGLGGVSTHATSIGGILIGNDENAFHSDFGDFKYVGAAPGATIKISEFWRFISSFTPEGKKIDTDILTMSLGVVFESWWTRRLELLAEEQGTVILAGIGNGNDVYDPPLYPAAGGNVIAVGVIDSLINTPLAASIGDFSLPRPAHSSYGPTPDGRCGVDIVAPGNCLVPDADSVDGYAVAGSCSSFATPVVAGTVALLTQHAKADDELAMAVSKYGGNCVIKSILLNSARKLPYWHKGSATEKDDHEFSLDFVQGAGAIDAVAAFEQLTSGQQGPGIVAEMGWDSGLLAKKLDSLKYYRFEIAEPADKFITVTLTWNRHYKNEYPFAADLAADRDLRIELWGSAKGIVGSEILLD